MTQSITELLAPHQVPDFNIPERLLASVTLNASCFVLVRQHTGSAR